MKTSGFRSLSGWIEKCKPALNKSDSSWDNSYCLRLVIVSLDVNVVRLQFLVSEESFFAENVAIFEAISCCEML